MALTKAQLASASVAELLQQVQQQAETTLRACILQSALDLGDEFPDPEKRTIEELRQFAQTQEQQQRPRFEAAFRFIHGEHSTPNYGLSERVQQQQHADLERHIGWRHAHRATLLAVTNIIKDVTATATEPAWQITDNDFERLQLAVDWVRGDASTKGLLMTYARKTNDPEIWGSIQTRLHPMFPQMAPSGSAPSASQKMYVEGFIHGMEELASCIDAIVATTDLDRERQLTEVMDELGNKCNHLRDESLQLWADGDKAMNERNQSQEALRRATDARRLVGMTTGAWEGALSSEAGEALMQRAVPWRPKELAELLANDFEEVVRRYETFTELDVEAVRVLGAQRLASVTTLRPRPEIVPDGRGLTFEAAL